MLELCTSTVCVRERGFQMLTRLSYEANNVGAMEADETLSKGNPQTRLSWGTNICAYSRGADDDRPQKSTTLLMTHFILCITYPYIHTFVYINACYFISMYARSLVCVCYSSTLLHTHGVFKKAVKLMFPQ